MKKGDYLMDGERLYLQRIHRKVEKGTGKRRKKGISRESGGGSKVCKFPASEVKMESFSREVYRGRK